jgi:glycosyltransferase involved in cell wall biosynthesis
MSVWLERRAATFTDNIIVVSECDRSRGLEYAIAKPSVFEVIPYGIEKRLFEKRDESVRGEFGFESGDLVVGSIACLKHQKSPEDFVKLAATVRKMFPRVKFLLIGDGSLRPGIEKLVSKNGLDGQLVLAGWRSDIPRIMSAIDVFVLTSLWEGLPISVLEAMAASLPVVATDTGGIKEVISSGDNGFLVRTRDINLMTDYVVDLLRDEGLRRRIGSRGSASIEGRLGVEEMTRKTQGLYSAIISRKKGKLC